MKRFDDYELDDGVIRGDEARRILSELPKHPLTHSRDIEPRDFHIYHEAIRRIGASNTRGADGK